MVRLHPDRYIVSAGQYHVPTVPYNKTMNGTDRTAGAGFAHLIVFSGNGSQIANATLIRRGAIEYHNGGIDFDGKVLRGDIAQYRPNSTAYVYTVRPETFVPEAVLNYNDHLSGVVHDVHTNRITALNWGSRNASTWNLDHVGPPPPAYGTVKKPGETVRNPSYFIDYQDCKFLGHPPQYHARPVILCDGVATIDSGSTAFDLGGVAIVDVGTMLPLNEAPIAMTSALGVPLTQNPIDASEEDGRLRLDFLLDQHSSTLYVVEAEVDSPY